MPTESRIVPGPTPAARSSSSSSCRCVVLAGWMMRLLESPTFARCDHNVTPRMKSCPAARPPWQSNENTAPGALRQIFLNDPPVTARAQAGVCHVRRELVRLEIPRHRRGILDMTRHPQRQRLESLQEQERIEGAHARAEIAQGLGAQLHQIPIGAEGFVELEPVIGRRRFGDHRKSSVRPVELPRVDHHAADARAVATDELRGRMQDDVRAPLDRAAEKRRRERVVHDQRQLVLVRNGRDASMSSTLPPGFPIVSP